MYEVKLLSLLSTTSIAAAFLMYIQTHLKHTYLRINSYLPEEQYTLIWK